MSSKILIIDDEQVIRFGFERTLSDKGYEVKVAEDYDSAIKSISETRPDLIISDIILGSHSGIDILHEVKKRGLNSPVIMITGEPNIKTSTEALRLGAFDYITKPIRKENLLRMARHGLRYKDLMDNKHQLELDNLRVRKNMEAIFSSLKEGVITVDQNINIIEANPAVEDICGFNPSDMVGKSFEKRDINCSGDCIKILKETLKNQKATPECQVECKSLSNQNQVLMVSGTPLRYEGSKISGAVLVLRNVTKRVNLERQLKRRHQFHRIIGKSQKMVEIFNLIENLSDTDSTALITGETGTGKELVAHAIHHNSPRKDKPFIKVNCSALSENLLESELFGHIKGAFTGAVDNKKGRFELAHKGSLFLDEIGDISPLIQLKLLRVLQEKEFERVGDSTTIKTDVRILAATNCNLKEKVKLGKFREDLYYRIKVVNLELPPLKERRQDILLLTDHFLKLFNKRFKKMLTGFSNEVSDAFMNYSWPGNIRELEHAIEHGFVLCKTDIIGFEHIPVEIKEYFKKENPSSSEKRDITRENIIEVLEKTDWNKAKAARILGMGRRTIYNKIEKYNIVKPEK